LNGRQHLRTIVGGEVGASCQNQLDIRAAAAGVDEMSVEVVCFEKALTVRDIILDEGQRRDGLSDGDRFCCEYGAGTCY
jgi:PIN domain nuclease of toxin-antitoxin system